MITILQLITNSLVLHFTLMNYYGYNPVQRYFIKCFELPDVDFIYNPQPKNLFRRMLHPTVVSMIIRKAFLNKKHV